MATSTSFFGQRRGSTRSHTYQVYRGKQVTKDRVTKVTNPQSNKQMKQRIRLTAVASFAAYLKQLLDHSFQGVAYGQPSLSEFRRINLSNASDLVQVSFPPKDINDPGIANFQVSKGSLLSLNLIYDAQNKVFELNSKEGDPAIVPNVQANKQIIPDSNLLQDLANLLGIQLGDQFTLILQVISIDWAKTYASGSYDYYPSQFIISRVITDINDKECLDGWFYDDKQQIITNGIIQIDTSAGVKHLSIYNNGESSLPDSLNKIPSVWNVDAIHVAAFAPIVSRMVNGVYQRSQQYMSIVDEMKQYWTSYANAEKTYLKDNTKSDKYLNGGTEVIIQTM